MFQCLFLAVWQQLKSHITWTPGLNLVQSIFSCLLALTGLMPCVVLRPAFLFSHSKDADKLLVDSRMMPKVVHKVSYHTSVHKMV